MAAKSGKGGDDMNFGEDRKVDLPAGGDEGVVLDDNDCGGGLTLLARSLVSGE